jgi:hypothetical protein
MAAAALWGNPLQSPAATNIVDVQFITGTTNWVATNTYILTNFVYVMSNAVLNIEAGTVIKGRNGTYQNVGGFPSGFGCLVVIRGGKIFAEGTCEKPIIFTAEADDVNDPFDLPISGSGSRGLWGGIILNGNATINSSVRLALSPLQDTYEGLPDAFQSGEALFRFGGNNDNDSSGVLRYVSVRHSGKVIESNREVNGITLGGIGRGTVLECCEAYLVADDGFEWFGGTVNSKYLVSAFCDDDCFDGDQGWRGKNQFWFSIQATDIRDEGGEFNGVPNELDAQNAASFPFNATYEIYNWTAIGAGKGGTNTGNEALVIRQANFMKLYNSIFTQFDGRSVQFGTNAQPDVRHNLFFQNIVGNGNGYGTAFAPAALNPIADPLLKSISRTNLNLLDPRIGEASPAYTGFLTPPLDGFYVPVDYKGAFNSANNWTLGWSVLDQNAFMRFKCPPYKQLPPSPLVVAQAGPNEVLSFPTTYGLFYQLQANTNLQAGAGWTNNGAAIPGNATTVTITNISAEPQKFFRVIVSP